MVHAQQILSESLKFDEYHIPWTNESEMLHQTSSLTDSEHVLTY
jgi:hypothetical protein